MHVTLMWQSEVKDNNVQTDRTKKLKAFEGTTVKTVFNS